MKIYKQLSIFLENRPGVLADVTEEMARRKINLTAISVSDTVDHAVVRMLVSDPRKTVRMLEERGVLVVMSDVLVVALPNKPGTLAEMSRALSKAKVNIEYSYGASPIARGQGVFVLRVDKIEKAKKALSPLVRRKRLKML